jgi:hypothetical protein
MTGTDVDHSNFDISKFDTPDFDKRTIVVTPVKVKLSGCFCGKQLQLASDYRVARWYIFIPKHPILGGLGMENSDIVFYHLVCICTLWSFALLCGNLVRMHYAHWLFSPHFGILYQGKSGNRD